MSRRGTGKDTSNKKHKADKIEVVNTLKENLPKYQRVYVLEFSSKKSDHLNQIRRRFRSSVLSLAKNSLIGFALGTTEQNSTLPNIYQLNQYLKDNTGIFMTNETHDTVVQYFQDLHYSDYATSGFIPDQTFTVPAGPLPQFVFSLDSYLRELGLPVQLDNGTITNVRDYDVCVAGKPLTKNAARLLKQFDQKIATFSVTPIAYWENGQIFTPNQ
ncbi:mRNA turnover protein 4 [Histomonas meleagridis]|uniref:mRNA turnover protein 4 n=1 Tax=Histomonas meleagridis TaxID=135588 RepID=UPI003559A94D|nr:mRNA turnover protein 4 [Histomonas meleagridis]KAH0798104.1 mRNA turnover protein 4 [Histomonas meleagridis]